MTAFNTALIDGASYSAFQTAAVSAVNNLGGGNYSVDSTQFNGSLFDFWAGTFGAPAPSDIVSNSIVGYNSLLAPGIITFAQHEANGTTIPAFGGDVIAWSPYSALVDVIDGFTPISKTAGTYVGTLDPSHFEIFSLTDLSQTEPGYGGPALPLLFGNSGTFSTPEPSTYAILFVALAIMTVVRHPSVRRRLASLFG